MRRYIDAEKLKRFVESIGLTPQKSADYNDGRDDAKMMVLDFIDSLQREQPEVDLEKYIENEINHYGLSLYEASYGTFSASQIDRIIRKAFELGLNARKEE